MIRNRLALALALALALPFPSPLALAAPDAASPPAPSPPTPGAEAISVTFQVNDSLVKNKLLPGVRVGIKRSRGDTDYAATGVTTASGKMMASLPPGEYFVTYLKDGYVPVRDSATQLQREGQLVTTTLSLMLEAAGQAGQRRVQIVLNWGNAEAHVKDADSHLMRLDMSPKLHVFWQHKIYPSSKVSIALDVDDTDWGGPETVTLLDPPKGRYTYWVHNYSGPPETLGDAGVKVRVLFGDKVEGEFSAPAGVDTRFWRPFAALVIDAMLEPKLVPFSQQELAAAMDRAEVLVPEAVEQETRDLESLTDDEFQIVFNIAAGVVVFLGLVLYAILRRKKR